MESQNQKRAYVRRFFSHLDPLPPPRTHFTQPISTDVRIFFGFLSCDCFPLQCAFLLWCMSPLEGSSVIYHRIIRPYFLKHESAIDDAVRSVGRLDLVYF